MVKKKSIFRYEAVLPIAILFVLAAIYTQFFMDLHARKGLEWALSKAVGAEVNIRSFESHLYRGTLQLNTIEITDADQPNRNLLVLNEIALAWQWDALLRGKVVINNASITGIATHTVRQKPGKVYPKSQEPSLIATEFQKLTQTAISSVKANSANTLFGDAIALMENKDTSVSQVASQLESTKLIAEFGQKIQTTQETWKNTITELSTPAPDLDKKVAYLKNTAFTSIEDAQKWLQNAKTLQSDVQLKIDAVAKAQAGFNSDIANFNGTFGKINSSIATDMKTMGKYIQIPKMPEAQLSTYLLNTYLSKYLRQYETAKIWADTYLPPNLLHKKEQVTITPIPRKKGILYTYGKQNSYPLFWLKHAEISSVASPTTPAIGALKGEITDLSTDQLQTQKPFECHLRGDFPGINIQDMTINIQIDRRDSVPLDLFEFQIGAYPIQTLTLVDSPDLKLALKEAKGRVRISAKRQAQQLNIIFTQYFENAVFDVHAENPLINDISVAAFSQLKEANIEGTLTGTIPQLSFAIHSDLGNALSDSFSMAINKRLEAEKEKIQKEISQKLDIEVNKLKNTVTQFNNTYSETLKTQSDKLSNVEKEITALQKQADEQINGWKKEANAKVENEKKKVLDEAKKQLPSALKKFF